MYLASFDIYPVPSAISPLLSVLVFRIRNGQLSADNQVRSERVVFMWGIMSVAVRAVSAGYHHD
jgi:hypothetical protein